MKLLRMNLQYFTGIVSHEGAGGYKIPAQRARKAQRELHKLEKEYPSDFNDNDSGKNPKSVVNYLAKTSPKKQAKEAMKKGKAAQEAKAGSGGSNGPSAATRNSWETGTGIAFMGQMSAQIVHDVMYKFILGDADLNNNTGKVDLMYRYNVNGRIVGLRSLIDMDIPDDAGAWITDKNNRYNIFNPDECCNADPTEYLQFEGNLMDYINSLSNQPFNEVYWTHEEEDDHQDAIGPIQKYAMTHNINDPDAGVTKNNRGKVNIPHATLHYRQTPFEPNQWFQLPILYFDDSDVISYQLNNNDDEEYSVFNITNSSEPLMSISNMPPVTDDHEELQRHYGYKYMDITSEYFINTKSQVDMSTTDLVNAISRQDEDTQTGLAGLGYPSYETFECYFGPDSASQVLQNKDPVLLAYLPMSNILGGSQLYHDATNILENHLDNYVIQMLQYNIQRMFITYQEANQDTQALSAESAQASAAGEKNINFPKSVSSPLQLPVGNMSNPNNGDNPVYQQWQNELYNLRNLYLNNVVNDSDGLEQDLINLVNSSDNRVTTPLKNDVVSNDDRVITLQKAGQLAMKYMLSLSPSSKEINNFLTNSGVIALNPWLGQVEDSNSFNSSSSNKSKSHSSNS